MRRHALLLTVLCTVTTHAQGTAPVIQGIKAARREIVAVLPVAGREDIAAALKAASARGTVVYLISERASLRRSGYLLNLSHGPGTIRTYLTSTAIGNAWIIVDGSWAATGWGLEYSARSDVQIVTDRATLQRTLSWARQVTKSPPVPKTQILQWFYGK